MFWHDGQNQKAFHLVWKRAKKLVRYVLPKKVQGRIHFGFDDPYDTGQVLTVVSPFYGLIRENTDSGAGFHRNGA